MAARISAIIGLGNPGNKYIGTRHNIGFEILDLVHARLGGRIQPATRDYGWSRAQIDGDNLWLCWPTTYMNLSGLAVASLMSRLELSPGELLVVSDDLNLPLGTLRFRASGSDGGQKGLRSIIDSIGTQEFPRLRVGIGEPPENTDPADYVLSRFSPDERDVIEKSIAKAAEGIIFAVHQPFELVMSQYNGNPALSSDG